ncbi:Ferritin-like metal-binding protein YciE [Sphingomonas palmae]|uniref:Ferritin-like metal-binding protein YciE n=1 Tax=Sphingomonas palmae TaxID=1855283 RepID=A0A1H7KJI6_9SPHN|nr:ferritin-like domain-containing protein [Sphingomonas palmae]SEK86165.1 Ferritin-like metal-binding protein YciE [Sphingomonas palmae]
MASYPTDVVQSVFVTGLKNAHGVEHQALALIDRQLDHLEHYPQVADRLRLHRSETEQQIQRLEEILSSFNETHSTLKDIGLSISGNLAAIAHVFAPDEILKNTFANLAFENFEAASYKSLITLADAGNFAQATPLLTTSLDEELSMANWVDEHNAELTLAYVQRRAAGNTASH